MAIIKNEELKTLCKIGEEDCCRYIIASADGFECAKNSSLKLLIDQRVTNGIMRAVGDNCPGI